MSSPQLTDANTSREWIRIVGEPATGQARSPSQVAIEMTQRRQRFVRLVTYMVVGLVGFTLLAVASFAWRQRSMKAALEARAPVSRAAALEGRPAAPAVSPAPETNTETGPAPPAPVAAAVTRPTAKKVAAAPAVVKSKPAVKATQRTSPRAKAASHRQQSHVTPGSTSTTSQ